MTSDAVWANDGLALDVEFGYINARPGAPLKHHPRLVLNTTEASMLRVIREELRRCRSFTWSVAFVSASALAMLKQDLLDFEGDGCIVTSDYLAFNSPQAFAELLNLQDRGIDVRIHSADAFHPKGYVFEHSETYSAVVGSANLTATALVRNHEWNLLVSAAHGSDLAQQFDAAVRAQLRDSVPITRAWVDAYAEHYVAPADRPRLPRVATPPPPDDGGPTPGPVPVLPPPTAGVESPWERVLNASRQVGHFSAAETEPAILPNRMQREALHAIEEMRRAGARRVVIISATGTGKTILSALAVKAANPARVLFLAHREQILSRTRNEYRRVLGGPSSDYGLLTGTRKEVTAKYLFATIQTLSRSDVMQTFPPDAFDYVIVDEAHRSGAETYRRLIDYLKPAFLMGMTATPERMDGFNVFELFEYNVPYEIRLNHALEADMLSPFHYYGIADITFEDGSTTTDSTTLQRLTSDDRVLHLLSALETYGQAGVTPRGLIFCSRRDEAAALAEALNGLPLRGKPLRVVALSGLDSIAAREDAVRRLESGELDYILTVDIFNEGVDIPTVNQVVMLRQTQSAIIFVQQLGRGLRKADGKDYLVVIDVIGNYANNYMIPIALFGNDSLNKESLRRDLIAAEERGAVAGLSSVQFDRIAEARVLEAISRVKLDSLANLKKAIRTMETRVGRLPDLWDFVRFESVDPVLLATATDSYPALLQKVTGKPSDFSPLERKYLAHFSHEILTAKRPHEIQLIKSLLENPSAAIEPVEVLKRAGLSSDPRTTQSVVDSFTLERHSEGDQKRYQPGALRSLGERIQLRPEFVSSYVDNGSFRHAVDDLVATGAAIVADRYSADRPFTPGSQYSRKDAMRQLCWPRSWVSTIYGYKVDRETASCPIFVTLHKADDVTASTAYEDALVDRSTMVWYTRSRRTLASEEVRAIVANEVDLHVFVKKDDAEGTDFYYLGQAASDGAIETTMPDKDGKPLPVVRMNLRFPEPIPVALFDYFHPQISHTA